jgi:hypothetical protein
MQVRRFVLCLGLFFVCHIPSAWAEFNFAQYKPGDLDEILALSRPDSGVKVMMPQKLKFQVTLISYAVGCNTGLLKTTMVMLGASKQFVDGAPISKCIAVKSAKGKTTSICIQDRVSEYLSKEIPLGTMIDIFCDYLFLSKDRVGILVGEFDGRK